MTDHSNETPAAVAHYSVVWDANLPAALGFLKDWVTAILQIEVALAGALGAAVTFNNIPTFSLLKFEKWILLVAIAVLGSSIACGVMILNLLPGAAQRKAEDAEHKKSDLYSIYNEPEHYNLGQHCRLFRALFFCALGILFAFGTIHVSIEAPAAAAAVAK